MPTLAATTIRIAGDAANLTSGLRVQGCWRGGWPLAWVGGDLVFQLGIFDAGQLASIPNIQSVTLDIQPTDATGIAPDMTQAPALSQTVSGGQLNQNLSLANWNNGTDQNCTFTFTGGLSGQTTSLTPGQYWLAIYAQRTDSTGGLSVLASGVIVFNQSGSTIIAAPSPAIVSVYQPTITGLTGGTPANLDGWATVNLPAKNLSSPPYNQGTVFQTCIAQQYVFWELVPGPAPGPTSQINNGTGYVIPNDNATSNKYWVSVNG